MASNERLRPIVDAFMALGATAEPIVYREELDDVVVDRLSALDGVLVWVDPIGKNGETRGRLDAILRTVADRGVWVSAHPDVIAAIGTKEVLFRTCDVGWGDDVHRYRSVEKLSDELPIRLATGPRVLKQHRGNGGIGVWKIQRADQQTQEAVTLGTVVAVHEAHNRDLDTDAMPLAEFCERCATSFADGGCIVDQPFQPRVAEGIIRSFLVMDEIVGFAIQGPGDLIDQPDGAARIMGLPSPKTMFPPDHPRFARLRDQLEHGWLDALQDRVGIPTSRLPALWDIDFLLGARTRTGEDTYVLCEINASCITPFPPETPRKLARRTLAVLATTRT